MDNLLCAHEHAKQKKKKRKAEISRVEENLAANLQKLQESLLNKSYKTSEYHFFQRVERGKLRDIADLTYYPDRITHWALINVIGPIIINNLIYTTYAALPGRGTHRALTRLHRWMKEDAEGTAYCLKIDVRHFYESIDREILKEKFRKIIKCKDTLWLMDEIVDSYPRDGLPIGTYTSQYYGNYYLSSLDHFVKEDLHIPYYMRYMDDMIFLSSSKDKLRECFWTVDSYLKNNLHVAVKDNWQIFPVDIRGIDFLGYRSFRDYTLVRDSTKKNYQKKVGILVKRLEEGGEFTESDRSMLASYAGILQHADCHRLQQKVTKPLIRKLDDF